MRRVKAIMATTEPIAAYGGIRLTVETLQGMAQKLRSQSVPSRLFHDAREPLYVENVDAGVRKREDGEHELWVQFDTEEEGWVKYEAARHALGASGGMSFTLSELFAERPGDTEPPAVSVTVAADAHHFPDEQILAAAEEFTDAEAVSASRLYQFSAAPLALVVIQFLLQEGAQIPPGILSAALYDALRHFRLPGKTSPALTLEVNEGMEGRKVIATIPMGTEPTVAERAIAAFESIATQPGTYEYTSDGNWRIISERKRT